MRITCPQCGFSRQIPDDKVPDTAELATCPKCSHRFRFRTLDNGQPTESAPAPEATGTPEPEAAQPDFRIDEPEQAPEPAPEPAPAASQADTVEIDVPFERLDQYGFFPGIWLTIRRVMLSPRLFFRVMPLRGLAAPLAFYLLLFEFSLVMDVLWGKAGLPPVSGIHPGLAPLDPGLGGPAGPVTLFVIYPAMAAVIAFVTSGVLHAMLKLMRSGERGFEATFRAQTYSNSSLILSVLPYGYLGGILWGLVLLVIALKNVHRTSWLKVAMAFAVLLGIQFLLAWSIVQAALNSMPAGGLS